MTLSGFRSLAGGHRRSIRKNARIWYVIVMAALVVYACANGG